MKFLIDLYDTICNWFIAHPISSGSLMAFILAIMRIFLSGQRNIKVMFIESLMCAFLSVGVTYLLTSFWQIKPEISIFVGSMCGYLGVDNLKLILNKFLINKLQKGVKNDLSE